MTDCDERCLIIRHFPIAFTENDIRDFVQMFDAVEITVFVSHQAAFADFTSNQHARDVLALLHQVLIDGTRLFVEYAPRNRHALLLLCSKPIATPSELSHTTDATQSHGDGAVNETLRRLYATADSININQPPPPYLRYEYPKVNRDIIDSISIALECVPKFYVQVLHLMNRMNLEPPFVPGDKRLHYESAGERCNRLQIPDTQFTTTATQTDEIIWKRLLHNKRKHIESDESELESSSLDENTDGNACDSKLKRKKLDRRSDVRKLEMVKERQHNVLKMQRMEQERKTIEKPVSMSSKVCDAFELNADHLSRTRSIKIVAPNQLKSSNESERIQIVTVANQSDESNEMIDSVTKKHELKRQLPHILTDAELKENRIPADQLKTHPLFQKYDPGPISNRLYIKNIAKDVTEDDLKAIYYRYLEQNCGGVGNIRTIDIRLMTTGRMKGQAFVTFDGPYLDCDYGDDDINTMADGHQANKYHMIERALNETNGFILKSKVLVVVYGRKK